MDMDRLPLIAPDDPRLEAGFHPCDAAGAAPSWRWTDGDAVLPTALWDGCRGVFSLRIRLSGSALPRWIGPGETNGVVDLAEVRRQV